MIIIKAHPDPDFRLWVMPLKVMPVCLCVTVKVNSLCTGDQHHIAPPRLQTVGNATESHASVSVCYCESELSVYR